jgi:aryl-alcohol dehydrogenase-like predicted oxidoreductase
VTGTPSSDGFARPGTGVAPAAAKGQGGAMRMVTVDGVDISVIGLGTWQFGSKDWGYGDEYASKEAGAIVQRALDLGVNLFDTAEIYAMGKSERILGAAIAGHRDRVFIASKVFPVMPLAPIVEQRARASAKRLGVDRIDLYQVHWPNPVVPLKTTMDGMRKLLDDGVIGHVGVSNFSLAQWKKAEELLGRPVLSNQVKASLVDRKPFGEMLEWAQANDRLVIAYSPLGQGLLGAKYDARNRPSGPARQMNPLFLPENLEAAGPLLDELRAVAAAHGSTAAQVALAWVISHPNVVAIPGASNVGQLEANVAAADLILDADEIATLTETAGRFQPTRGLKAAPALVKGRFTHS